MSGDETALADGPQAPSAAAPPRATPLTSWIARRRGAGLRIPPTAVRVAVLVLLAAGFALVSPFFLRPANLLNIATNVAVAGIIACPLTILLIAGQVDLSVGSAVAFVGIVLAWAAPLYGLETALLLAFGAALVVAVTNGVAVTVLGINSLIATLATLSIFRGVARLIPNGQTLRLEGFGTIGTARIRVGPLDVPLPVILFALIALAFALVLRHTVYGRYMYAIGANPNASRLAGIRIQRKIFVGFVVTGFAVALSAMILVSQVGAALPVAGEGLELFVITGVILGGASLSGGRGTIAGTVSALFILGVLDNGLTLLSVQSFWQEVARGMLLLGAVAFDQLRVRYTQAE